MCLLFISEKCQRLTFGDEQPTGSFQDVKKLYESEKNSILKTTPLTQDSVQPSKLQLQNVKHVLKVFNEKVVAALRIQGSQDTADFIQSVLNWWNHVNVSSKGQDARLKDPHRAVQVSSSTTLDTYAELFEAANSGHGVSRVECLTYDTKKALVQTMRGLAALCRHLLDTAGFSYVLLREIQSDRIEGEFGVYRQSTGGNAFMTVGDVSSAAKKRLATHAATFLKSVEMDDQPKVHDCIGPLIVDDAASIENSISDVTLTNNEKSCCAYVAGWLEGKCSEDLSFSDEEPLVNSDVKNFIEEVSRGSLTVPHECTYQLVEVGLCFVKNAHHRACCCRRLCMILSTMGSYYNLDSVSQCQKLLRSLSNVLLHGLHNLEKDQQRNGVLLQTSVKKARMSE